MKKNKFKYFFLAPILLVTSCGYGLSEVIFDDAYNSVYWNENYYRVWDAKIDEDNPNNKITNTLTRELDKDKDFVFTSYKVDDPSETDVFAAVEPNRDNFVYDSDNLSEGSYGKNHNMSSIDNSFKYNITSKLFDGHMFCGGGYEKVRVQVAPNNNIGDEPDAKPGFGRLFKKELRYADYFAMNFKCAVDYKTQHVTIAKHYSSIDLKLSFYLKNDEGYTKQIVTYTIDKVPTNSGDTFRSTDYMFFGFKLKSNEGDEYLDLTRCAGMSIEYTFVDEISTTYNLGHSMLVYEVLFPHSTWY